MAWGSGHGSRAVIDLSDLPELQLLEEPAQQLVRSYAGDAPTVFGVQGANSFHKLVINSAGQAVVALIVKDFGGEGYPLRYSSHSMLWPERLRSHSRALPVVVTIRGRADRGKVL